jgi:hypothetical protein
VSEHPCGVPVIGAVQPYLATISGHDRKLMLLAARDGWWCHYCGCPLVSLEMPWVRAPGDRTPTLDHRTPRIAGGTHALSNLVLACRPCNSSKGSTPYDLFLIGRRRA